MFREVLGADPEIRSLVTVPFTNYNMNEVYGHDGYPCTDLRLNNGDGTTLFYPGLPALIGGRTDIPIGSIRLKLIRKGMEDYEYLVLLASVCGKQTAMFYVERIVQKPWQWESRPTALGEVRLEMGKILDRINRLDLSRKSQPATACRTVV
jgi:hypothetical protein